MSYNYLLLKQQNKKYASLDLKLAAVQKVETMRNCGNSLPYFPLHVSFMSVFQVVYGCSKLSCSRSSVFHPLINSGSLKTIKLKKVSVVIFLDIRQNTIQPNIVVTYTSNRWEKKKHPHFTDRELKEIKKMTSVQLILLTQAACKLDFFILNQLLKLLPWQRQIALTDLSHLS